MILEAPHKNLFISEDSQSGILTASFAKDYPLKILIVEDDIVNQKLIERILLKLGYLTDTVSDGVQVLNSLVKKEYDVPEMDGLETTRYIRRQKIEQPYIIAMTANAMSNDREECLQIGMNDYIAKPMRLAEIIKILKTAASCVLGKN
ncbi:MAG: response regulator [Bacteroidia bacterium]|nr:response regulator [Bacteroidia bacterium]